MLLIVLWFCSQSYAINVHHVYTSGDEMMNDNNKYWSISFIDYHPLFHDATGKSKVVSDRLSAILPQYDCRLVNFDTNTSCVFSTLFTFGVTCQSPNLNSVTLLKWIMDHHIGDFISKDDSHHVFMRYSRYIH